MIHFDEKDFDVFKINGLEPRMEALIQQVRPKLEAIGLEFAPLLSTLVEDELFPHVAKHARRTVNPPDDTWVAWANSKRGYKKLPHFQLGLWETHLFAWFAIIYECPIKQELGKRALKEIKSLHQHIPADFVWSSDHTVPDSVLHSDLSEAKFKAMIKKLTEVKSAELLCGIRIDRDDPILKDPQALREKLLNTYTTLQPLYALAK